MRDELTLAIHQILSYRAEARDLQFRAKCRSLASLGMTIHERCRSCIAANATFTAGSYARGPGIRNNALQSETVSITQVRNVVSRNPLRSGVSALRCGLCQGPLASDTTACSSDRLLRALSHLGSLVRGCSARFHGDELPVGEMASAKAFRTRSVDRHSVEPGAARHLQVPPGNRGRHPSILVAKVLASCPAIRDLILDLSGDELPV